MGFTRLEYANDLAEALSAGGKEQLDAVTEIQTITHTSMQQIDWFNSFTNLDLNRPIWIVRVEYFEDDFAELLRRLGVDIAFDELEVPTKTEAHRFEYREIPSLSELAEKNLKNWYFRDFKFYELCEDWMSRNQDG